MIPYYTATVWRIVGNELWPRDAQGSRLKLLERVLKEEPRLDDAQVWYYVNRIYDIPLRRAIIELLDAYQAQYVTVPFDRKLASCESAMALRGIALNKARNDAIAFGHVMTPWSVILDGDCIFKPEHWQEVLQAMRQNDHEYLSIPHVRDVGGSRGEPMLAFRRGSQLRFNESKAFGDGDKLELLFRLGHNREAHSGHLNITGNMTKLVGEVRHLHEGNDELESSIEKRIQARNESIAYLAHKQRCWPSLELKVFNSLSRVHERVEGYFDYSGQYSSFAFDAPDNAKIVEVGSWQGKSAIYLATQFRAFGKRAHVFCVDTFDGGTDEVLRAEIAKIGGPEALKTRFEENVKLAELDSLIHLIHDTSTQASAQFADESLDVVFIDASHDYQSILSDISHWYPKVKCGGVIAGHDFDFLHPNAVGVISAVREFFHGQHLEVMPHGRVWKHVKYAPGCQHRGWV